MITRDLRARLRNLRWACSDALDALARFGPALDNALMSLCFACVIVLLVIQLVLQ